MLRRVEVVLFPEPPTAAFGPAGGAADRGRALFDLFQDRHIGITPGLARTLATFEIAGAPAGDPNWGRGYGLASGAIGLAGKMGYTPPWRDLFPTYLAVVAEPILRELALRSGEVSVTTLGATPGALETYERSCRTVETWVEKTLVHKEIMGLDFWTAAGVALLAAFRKQKGARFHAYGDRAPDNLPHLADVRLAQLVYGIEPELEDDRLWRKTTPRLSARSKRVRVGIRPREGGVTGVLHTRRIRDIADALPSAFVTPDAIRILKLIEEGFMIPHRPPYRRPERDLLSLTMQTRATQALEAGLIAKAAWVDAAIRLRILLANLSMAKSELGYGHMVEGGNIAAALSIEANRQKVGLDAMQLKDTIRKYSVSVSTLFPDIFDVLPQSAQTGRKADNGLPEIGAAQQVMAACAARAAAAPAKNQAEKAKDADEYARVCLIEIAPSVVGHNETVVLNWRKDRHTLGRRYGFGKTDDLFYGTILCPPILETGAVFVVCSDDGTDSREIVVSNTEDPKEALGAVTGALSAWIITQNILAVANG